MAKISNTKTLFFVTSPRSPIKLIPELQLLKQFEGKVWDEKTQSDFTAVLLKESSSFKKKPKDPSFTARDRINRAPKSLGFVNLEPTIQITEAGKKLDSDFREEIFLRQLLKFQLPSYYHPCDTSIFEVKPFLEIIRLIFDLDGLTKTEMQIFGLQVTKVSKYSEICEKILKFREDKLKIKQGKKIHAIKTCISEFNKIYAKDLPKPKKAHQIELIKKMRNARDYADACFRYLLFTGLFEYDFNTSELQVKENTRKEVEYILKNVPRAVTIFSTKEQFKEYLFDPFTPSLFWDVPTNIIAELERLKIKTTPADTIEELKKKLIEGWKKTYELTINKEVEVLVKKNDLGEVFGIYDSLIESNSELIEPNLYLEWNTWRAFVVLDDGKINGNFLRDRDGNPISTAGGGKPDLECDYKDFGLIVEVTRSSGATQYNMEGEPVARHLGDARRRVTGKPIYAIFIPIKLHPATLTHFFMLLKYQLPYYNGTAEIIPIELSYFVELLKRCGGNIQSQKMKLFIEKLIVIGKETQNPEEWYAQIKKSCQSGL